MIDELRAALYVRLTAGAPLGAVPAYDFVPFGTEKSPPFVAMDETETEASDTDTSDGATVTTDLIVYSRYQGTKELGDLMDKVRGLFHHYALPVAGSTVILVTAVSTGTRTGPDGVTREGVIRVRVLLDDITP